MKLLAKAGLRKALSHQSAARSLTHLRSAVRSFSETSGGTMTSGVMYNWRVAAVDNALAQRGKAEGPLTVEDLVSLGHLDQYHYLGTQACDELIETLGLTPGMKLLDVGSGIGGPARYIAAKSGCNVTGVELQADLVEAARRFTGRVGLADKVAFQTGDFQEVCKSATSGFAGSFDHFISLLVFCHFPDLQGALKACHDCLKPGGTFLIEDLALVGTEFTAQEDSDLRNVVSAPGVTSPARYIQALEAAGLVDIEVQILTEPWKAWTKARHESFRDSKEETVRLHGEELFESRCHFYGVIDALFAGGNMGGVRITGRKPTEAEVRLRRGRQLAAAHNHAQSTATLNEMGSTVASTAASKSQATTTLQPLFPAGPDVHEERFHDSLQYHFFFPGIFVAGRIFHTKTLQQHSAWMFDTATGSMTELFAPSYEVMRQEAGADGLLLDSEQLQIVDGPGKGEFAAKAQGLTVHFEQKSDFCWLPAGQQRDAVIHRPDLHCRLALPDGRELEGVGYSKRYYGLYPRFWGYRFIHAHLASAGSQPSFLWTADAAFGDHKYNYFKLLQPSGSLVSAETKDTWQQDTSGFAIINGVRHEVHLRPLCTWETVIGGPQFNMESKMQNRYCEVELLVGGKASHGFAYNERCYGTLG